ncbi:MAG: PrsW family glutamic-type intramembrane protease [Patescibacteria group bacterium]|nr:PrsW family glutamic-type intramembrane protease [Patescibacteria group bacterium]
MLKETTIFYTIIGGLLPVLIWLWFWLREDKLHPEPRKYIFLAFIFGIISALLVLPVEEFLAKFLPVAGIIPIIVFSFAEEIFKYFGAYFSSLRKKYMDEPIDAVIYMITIALGFAALENTLFLMHSIKITGGDISQAFLVGNMRFIGATLLHTISSGVIGLFIALSFYKRQALKKRYLLTGITLSVALHSFFNFFIIKAKGGEMFFMFIMIWIVAILLIFLFEVVKKIKRKKRLAK